MRKADFLLDMSSYESFQPAPLGCVFIYTCYSGSRERVNALGKSKYRLVSQSLIYSLNTIITFAMMELKSQATRRMFGNFSGCRSKSIVDIRKL